MTKQCKREPVHIWNHFGLEFLLCNDHAHMARELASRDGQYINIRPVPERERGHGTCQAAGVLVFVYSEHPSTVEQLFFPEPTSTQTEET